MKIFKSMTVMDADSLGDLMHDLGRSAIAGCDDTGAPLIFTFDLEAWPEADVMAVDASGDEVPAWDLDTPFLFVLVPEEAGL